MFSVKKQVSDLPKTRTPEKEQREWPTINCESQVMAYEYHRDSTKNTMICVAHREDGQMLGK